MDCEIVPWTDHFRGNKQVGAEMMVIVYILVELIVYGLRRPAANIWQISTSCFYLVE